MAGCLVRAMNRLISLSDFLPLNIIQHPNTTRHFCHIQHPLVLVDREPRHPWPALALRLITGGKRLSWAYCGK